MLSMEQSNMVRWWMVIDFALTFRLSVLLAGTKVWHHDVIDSVLTAIYQSAGKGSQAGVYNRSAP